jgi:gamma-glutamylcyclotransferase (GGCT)/AIG2-like uncharacterized protein YtfP
MKLFVYGTLRQGANNPCENYGGKYVYTTTISGAVLYDLGSFPGLKLTLDGPTTLVVGDVYEVDQSIIERLDQYEGYRPDNPENSLYIRRELPDFYVYEFNDKWEGTLIPGGDWLEYRK